MIRLINQTRKDNGVSELPVNDALMNAAQTCSNRRYTWHHALEESQAAADAGYPYTHKRIVLKEGRPVSWTALPHNDKNRSTDRNI